MPYTMEVEISIHCFVCNREIDFMDEDFFQNEKMFIEAGNPANCCRECTKKVITDSNRGDYKFITS